MLQDDHIMTWGKHKGEKIKDISRNYWIFINDRGWLKGELLEWVKANHPIINYGKKHNGV